MNAFLGGLITKIRRVVKKVVRRLFLYAHPSVLRLRVLAISGEGAEDFIGRSWYTNG